MMSDYSNPTLPVRPTNIRALPEAAWRAYRQQVVKILCSSAYADVVRFEAFMRLIEADSLLWTRTVANMGEPVPPADGFYFINVESEARHG